MWREDSYCIKGPQQQTFAVKNNKENQKTRLELHYTVEEEKPFFTLRFKLGTNSDQTEYESGLNFEKFKKIRSQTGLNQN